MTDTTTAPDRARIIHALVHPKSIALVGASDNFAKLNGRPLKHLIEKGYAGRILPVNPKYKEIGGHACYPDIASLPEAADLAVVARHHQIDLMVAVTGPEVTDGSLGGLSNNPDAQRGQRFEKMPEHATGLRPDGPAFAAEERIHGQPE